MRATQCLFACLLLIIGGHAAPRPGTLSPRRVVNVNGQDMDIPWADGLSDADIETIFGSGGGGGKPQNQRIQNPETDTTEPDATNDGPTDAGSNSASGSQSASLPSQSASVGAATVPAGSDNSSTASNGSGCKKNLKSVCFNSGYNVGMFDTIGAADSWISFGPLPSGSGSQQALEAQVPMIAFASDVAAGVELAKKSPPPEWLLTFNEPDYSYAGITPTMSPEDAAQQIQPLLQAVTTDTKLVAPVPADATSDWLTKFFAACNCQDRFAAFNIHIYVPTSDHVKEILTTFHDKWNMPVWVTEIAPGSGQCGLSADQVSQFMKDIYAFGQTTDWIERIYWNTGNQIDPNDQNVCQSYLLKTDGTPAPLLDTYKAVDCQGGAGGTA